MSAAPPQGLPLDVAWQQAVAHHQAGRLHEAEQLYRAILQAQPNHPDTNHNLGVLAGQVGQHAAGLPYLQAAMAANPGHEQFVLSYVDALLTVGQSRTALDIIKSAMQRGINSPAARSLRQRADAAVLSDRTRAGEVAPSDINQLDALFIAGRYRELESQAGMLLARYSNSGQVWKILSASLLLQGKDALQSLQKTAQLLPEDAEVHCNLGSALRERNQMEGAISHFRRAVELRPDFAEIHYNLGSALREIGQFESAVASCRRALQIKPDYADAHSLLGSALTDMGELDSAVASFHLALEIQPSFAEAHSDLGNALKALGQLDNAVASYQRALEIKPDLAQVHCNLGNALHDLGQYEKSAESCRRALQIKPDLAEAHFNLGNALRDLGQLDGAIASFRHALEIKPGFVQVHVNLGNALMDHGQPNDALTSYRRALEIKPNDPEMHINVGNALQDLGKMDDVLRSYRQALEINPDFDKANNNMGNVLQGLGRLDEAVASYRRALEINPEYADAHGNLLFALSHDANVDAKTLFAEHCRFGTQFEAPLRAAWPQHGNDRDPDRRLQIGFVSGDLRNHAVATFIEPMLAHLAQSAHLSLHGYHNHAMEDEVTRRIKGSVTHWNPVFGLSDAELAQHIRDDRIDILIDLSGHTAGNRLLAFARKPAPLQVSWIGYPGTTGLLSMDYYLADRFFLPVAQFAEQFTEKIVHLPVATPFLPFAHAPAVNPLPALGSGHVTFGSFNRANKVSRSVIAVWSKLLCALPDSRMLLGGLAEGSQSENLLAWFAEEGVERERLSVHPRSDVATYLGLHHQVDLCLDTFPYTGGTTTCHALWMGVPTLTLAGHTPFGRDGAGLLGGVGLDIFIAHDADDFVRKGVAWAQDLYALAAIRAQLRARFAQSPIGQPDLVAGALEGALRAMWQRWCAGLPAAHF